VTCALAEERQQLTRVVGALFEARDVDVDLAEERFVAANPLFPRRHGGIAWFPHVGAF
jgi:hypothetical protein